MQSEMKSNRFSHSFFLFHSHLLILATCCAVISVVDSADGKMDKISPLVRKCKKDTSKKYL